MVDSSVDYWIKDQDIENLTLIGSSNLKGTGNASANTIRGNSGSNRLTGGACADILVGNAGIDTLYCGAGDDIFKLTEGNGYDKIRDFIKGEDKIDIRGFDNIVIVESLVISESGNHSNIYNGNDLLAIVFNETYFALSGDGFLI